MTKQGVGHSGLMNNLSKWKESLRNTPTLRGVSEEGSNLIGEYELDSKNWGGS